MTKPTGGRGQKAPYETVQVRCPVPIKQEVEALIAQYRDQVLSGSDSGSHSADTQDFEACKKLVFRFLREHNLTDQLGNKTPRMYRLNQFFNWLSSQNSSQSDTL